MSADFQNSSTVVFSKILATKLMTHCKNVGKSINMCHSYEGMYSVTVLFDSLCIYLRFRHLAQPSPVVRRCLFLTHHASQTQ